MKRITVYTHDIEVAAAASHLHEYNVSLAADGEQFLGSLRNGDDVIVIDGSLLDDELRAFLRAWANLVVDEADSHIVLLGDDSQKGFQDTLDGGRVRWHERDSFLADPASILDDGMQQRTPTAPSQSAPSAPGHVSGSTNFGSHLVVVASSKGGVGKTFVSTNLADLIATHMGGNTILVDLDFYGSDAATALNLLEGPTINDLLPHAGALTSSLLNDNCRMSTSGLHVLAGPERIELAELVTPGFVQELLEIARRTYTYVIVDTPPDPGNELLYDLVEQASRLILVTTPNSLAVRGVRLLVTLLKRLELWDDSRCEVILNMHSAQSLMSSHDLQRLLGAELRCQIRRDDDVVERSIFQGVPVVRMAPGHEITTELRRLAGRFSPVPPGRPQRRPWEAVPAALRNALARVGLAKDEE